MSDYKSEVERFIAKLRADRLAETTITKTRNYLRVFFNYVQKEPAELTLEDIEKWRYEMAVNRKYEPETMWASMCLVRKLLRFLGKNDVADKITMPKRPKTIPPEKEIWLLPEEEQLMIQKSKEMGIRSHVIIKLFLSSGVRVGELCGINLEDIDLDKQEILIRHGKGDKARYVPFDTDTKNALLEYLKVRKEPQDGSTALFTSKFLRRLSTGQSRIVVKECAALAGIKKTKPITPHKLRHTFITRVIEKSKDIPLAQKLAGHSDTRTTMRYHHTMHEEVMKKYKELFDNPGAKNTLTTLSTEEILRGLDSKFVKGELPYEVYIKLRNEYTLGGNRESKTIKVKPDEKDVAYM